MADHRNPRHGENPCSHWWHTPCIALYNTWSNPHSLIWQNRHLTPTTWALYNLCGHRRLESFGNDGIDQRPLVSWQTVLHNTRLSWHVGRGAVGERGDLDWTAGRCNVRRVTEAKTVIVDTCLQVPSVYTRVCRCPTRDVRNWKCRIQYGHCSGVEQQEQS